MALVGMRMRMLGRVFVRTWYTAAGIEVLAIWIVAALGLCWFAAAGVFTRTVSLRWQWTRLVR